MKVHAQPRWIVPISLGIAVIAIAVAAWALLRAPRSDTVAATSQQIADAKYRACTATDTVRKAVARQTHNDLGGDPVAVQVVAANSRLAMSTGASYLLAFGFGHSGRPGGGYPHVRQNSAGHLDALPGRGVKR